MTTPEERTGRLEDIVEEMRNRLNGIENRLNVQIGIAVTMWVTLAALIVART